MSKDSNFDHIVMVDKDRVNSPKERKKLQYIGSNDLNDSKNTVNVNDPKYKLMEALKQQVEQV